MFVEPLIEPFQPFQRSWAGWYHRRHGTVTAALAGETGMAPEVAQQSLLHQTVVQTVAGGVGFVLGDIVHDDMSALVVQEITAGKTVSRGRVEQDSFFPLTTWNEHQAAFLIIGDEWKMGITVLVLPHALHEKILEAWIETEVILHNECSLQMVVNDILCGQ